MSIQKDDPSLRDVSLPAGFGTVEVKTWGTVEELGNGLKNIFRQKSTGDDIGHAALIMRIPVNAENRKLIDEYCFNAKGSIKIPHKIKHYGAQPVYEIYWSFWPGRLNTMKADIQTERSGFAFNPQSDVLERLPPEVKARYIFQKQRKDLMGHQATINLAPVATPIIDLEKQSDPKQSNYLNNQLEKYGLEEQIQALEALKENYLAAGKEFEVGSKSAWEKKIIKPSSNFLTFLARFKNELPNNSKYAKIIKNNEITRETAIQLEKDIDKLIEKKQAEIKQLKQKSAEFVTSIYPPAMIIKNLKKEIKQLDEKLSAYDYTDQKEKEWLKLKDQPDSHTPKDIEYLLDVIDFNDPAKENLINSPTLTNSQIQSVIDAIIKHRNNLPDVTPLQEKLKVARDDLEKMYLNPLTKTVELNQKRIVAKEAYILEAQGKLIEIDEAIDNEEKNSKKLVASGNKKIAELEKLLADSESITVHADEKIKELEQIIINQTDNQKNIKILEEKLKKIDSVYSDKIVVYPKGKPVQINFTDGSKVEAISRVNLKAQRDQLQTELTKLKNKVINIDFVYSNSREKTAEEKKQFGNLVLKKSEDPIWALKNQNDVSKLINIILQDQKKLQKGLLLAGENIQYDNKREKTANEILQFGNKAHTWAIKTKKDAEQLISIMKEDMQKLEKGLLFEPVDIAYDCKREKTATEIKQFGNLIFVEKNVPAWTAKEKQDLVALAAIVKMDIEKAKLEIQSLQDDNSNIATQTPVYTEQLKEKIIKGTPTGNVVLKNFNIEEMLKKASELESTTSSFNLVQENCSTTSMKLLKAGAPYFSQHMFKWTENSATNPAANTFLTNPQAVYSTSRIIHKAQGGDSVAIDQIKKELFEIPNSNYYMKLNKLLAFRHNREAILQEIKNNTFGYLTIIPSLIKDLTVDRDGTQLKKGEQEVDLFFNKLNDAIRSQKLSLISRENPKLAIDDIKEKLSENYNNLPFFDAKTLEIVKRYILDLEAVDPRTDIEKIILEGYEEIMAERNERISCIEHALVSGHNIEEQLMCRNNHSIFFKWPLSKEEQAEKKVTQFIESYNELRKKSYGFSFFYTDFVDSLPKNLSFADKLHLIEKKVNDEPTSKIARAWQLCDFKEDKTKTPGSSQM